MTSPLVVDTVREGMKELENVIHSEMLGSVDDLKAQMERMMLVVAKSRTHSPPP